jgi:hypothetical protein
MFIADNLRRIMNILGGEALKKYLKVLLALFSGLSGHIRGKISCFNRFISGNLQIRYMKTDLVVMD